MRCFSVFVMLTVCVALAASGTSAQSPKDKKGDGPKGGKGGPGGKGGFGGGAQPGQILSPFAQEALNLTADQKKQVESLQKEVDERLAKILTDAQQAQLKEMQESGFGGKGPPGGKKKG